MTCEDLMLDAEYTCKVKMMFLIKYESDQNVLEINCQSWSTRNTMFSNSQISGFCARILLQKYLQSLIEH